jgi:antitoxin component of RelBE/YafQ-DinJ toxin-antitoxin module
MLKTTTFHMRLPASLKKTVQAIAEKNGVDLPTITRLFFTHVAVQGTVPLPWLTVNGFTVEGEKKLLKELAKNDVAGTLRTAKDIRRFVDEL